MSRPPRLAVTHLATLACCLCSVAMAGQSFDFQPVDCELVFADPPSDVVQLCSFTAAGCCDQSGCCGQSDCCGGNYCGLDCGEGCCDAGGCGLCGGELGDPWRLDSNDDGIDFGGWWQQGYTSGSTGMFNNIPHKFNTHQAWFYAEKVADGSCGTDWGFRADIMYGIDATDTQSFGNNPGRWDFINGWDYGPYGWAMPQLYGEVASGDLSVKVGHFYTLLGYEVVTAPDNFFFSHAMTMFNSEAFTHTGALATYTASDDVTVYAGWTLGWDTGFDQFGGGSNFLGGVSVALGDNATFTYITTAGDMGLRGTGYSHSTVLDITLTDKLNYVLQSDLVRFKVFGGINDEVGINQYLLYTINDRWAAGARVEWWKSDAGFNHGGQSLPLSGSNSYYAATFGLNYKPHANVTIRPEWRYDWFPGSAVSGYEQGIFGVDMILTY
ncbi:MAG: outer membrane beta-barrel protein [Fuerstiella sp.]